jgi:hypothetical protein
MNDGVVGRHEIGDERNLVRPLAIDLCLTQLALAVDHFSFRFGRRPQAKHRRREEPASPMLAGGVQTMYQG